MTAPLFSLAHKKYYARDGVPDQRFILLRITAVIDADQIFGG
jgi:hypothetical protein